MANLRHSITRVVLELDIAQERQAEPVRKRVGDFCRASLGEVLEACLIEFGTGDTVFLFERVELELGPVAEDRLEDDLARKIRAALRRFLAEKLPRRWPEPSAEAVPAGLGGASELAPLHGLADYLARGVLPGATGAATHPDRLLIAAADATPEALARLLRELGQKAGIRKRIASHVSESTLHRLIRLLEPDHAGFIIDLARALAEWPGPGLANRRVLSRMAWEFVLAYLLVERGLEFNRRAFVESLARQVAGRLAVSYGELAGRLARAESGRPELDGAVLLEIAAAGKSAEPESVSPARRRLQVLESFLSGGVMPWPVGIDPGLGINRILDSLMDEAPDELLYLLRRLGYRDSVRKRLAFEFSGRVIERLVGLLEPGDAGLIVAYVRDVAEVQARRPVVQQENRGFRKTLWEFVLTFLLCERGSHFNARSFVKSTLLKMAARYRIAYGELLLGLIVRSDLLRAVASQRYSLPSILLSLADEFHVGLVTSSTPRLAGEEHSQAHANPAPNGSGSQPRPNPHSQGHDDLDLLAHWLANGRPPAWSRFADAGGLRHLLAGLRRQRPEELARLWFDLAHDPAVAARSDIAAVVREFADLPHIDDGGMKASFDHPHPSPSSTPLRTGLPEGEGAYNAPPFDAVATWAGEAGAARMEDSARATPAAADALERLLRYGLWPAAAREGSEAEWVAWLASLTDGAVLAALRRVGPLESAVKRLARRLPAAFYERVFDLLAGTGLVPACRTALEALAGEDAAYAGQVRAYLLAYLLSQEREQPGPPDAEDLLRRVLSALAIRYGQPYRRLLETLANTVRGGELESMVAMLRREMRADAPTDGPVGAGFSPRPDAPLNLGRGLKATPTQALPEDKEGIRPIPIACLVDFLDSGLIPRANSGVAADAPQRWLAEALAANSKALCAELLTIGDRPDVVRRLLHYLPEDDLSRLIHALAPGYAGFALSYLLAGAGLAGDATLSPDQRSRARQVHWQTVLTLLLDAHAPSFSATRFLADVGHRVAQRLGLTFTRYAERLLRHARRKADTEHRYAALADMLEELGGVSQPAESAPESPEPPAPIEKSGPAVAAPEGMPPGSDVADDHLIQMRHFLRHGILPEEFDRDATALAFEQDIRDRPAEYRRLLLGALGRDLERLRLARWLPPAWFRRVLRLLLPDASETALTSLAGLREAAELMPGSSPALWRQWGAYELLREIHRRHGETGEDSGLLAQGEDIHATPADVGAGGGPPPHTHSPTRPGGHPPPPPPRRPPATET